LPHRSQATGKIAMTFKVTSDSFADGDYLPKDHILSADFGFGCAGGNRSPHLKWSGAPAGTKSFAITCYDPDAPTGSGFWHWLVVNIPADVAELPLGAGSAGGTLPTGALMTRTDFGIRIDICSRSSLSATSLMSIQIHQRRLSASTFISRPWRKPPSWGCSNAERQSADGRALIAWQRAHRRIASNFAFDATAE
jgi:hypothetical protein